MNRLMMIAGVLCLALESGGGAYPQGTIIFNNLGTNNGLVLLYSNEFSNDGVPLNQDLNFALLAGPPGMMPLMLQHKWLLSDGSAKGINVGPGLFADPTASVFSISGVAPGEPVNVVVMGWGGNYNSLGEAMSAGAAAGQGRQFTMFAGSAAAPPASLTSMPQLNICCIPNIPDPGTIRLMSIGGVAFWILHYRSRPREGSRGRGMGPRLSI